MKLKKIKKVRAKIPKFRGKCGNCFECCQSPILMDFSEFAAIKKKFGIHPRHTDRSLCPWYDTAAKKCAVYSERPLVCRLFGIGLGHLTCSHFPEEARIGMEEQFKFIAGEYFDGLGLPKIMLDHFHGDEVRAKIPDLKNGIKIFE